MGSDYANGYHVIVGWSDADGEWIARCSGMTAFIPGEAIATGPTQQQALQELCCALAATVDCFGQIVDKLETPPASPTPETPT